MNMSRSVIVQLDLFPDLLDQNDSMRRNLDYKSDGFGIWTVGDDRCSKREDVTESRSILVIYDRKEFEKWSVVLKHHYYFHETQTKGWGSSRTVKPHMRYRCRNHERNFKTREDAIAFAEKLLSVMDRVKTRRENIRENEVLFDLGENFGEDVDL
jgi:hypothetical protein